MDLEIFNCLYCKKNFIRGNVGKACSVVHSEFQTCCHYNDQPVSNETLHEIKKVLKIEV